MESALCFFRSRPPDSGNPQNNDTKEESHPATGKRCRPNMLQRLEIQQNIVNFIAKQSNMQITQFPCWWNAQIASSQPNPQWREIQSFNSIWGLQGIIPLQLKDTLKNEYNISPEKIQNIIAKIQLLIVSGMLKIWFQRCKERHKQSEL